MMNGNSSFQVPTMGLFYKGHSRRNSKEEILHARPCACWGHREAGWLISWHRELMQPQTRTLLYYFCLRERHSHTFIHSHEIIKFSPTNHWSNFTRLYSKNNAFISRLLYKFIWNLVIGKQNFILAEVELPFKKYIKRRGRGFIVC